MEKTHRNAHTHNEQTEKQLQAIQIIIRHIEQRAISKPVLMSIVILLVIIDECNFFPLLRSVFDSVIFAVDFPIVIFTIASIRIGLFLRNALWSVAQV